MPGLIGYNPPPVPQRPMGIGAQGAGQGGLGSFGGGGRPGGGYDPIASILNQMMHPQTPQAGNGGIWQANGSGGDTRPRGGPGNGSRPGGGSPWDYTGNVNTNLPRPPAYQNDPQMQSVFGQMQAYQGDLARNQDLQAQHAMQRQRASNSGALSELADMTLLQQGAGGNRSQQVRNAGFMQQQGMAGLNASLADSARTQQLASLGQLGAQAGNIASQAQSRQEHDYLQQVYNPAQLQLQAQGMNLQAQQAANQAAYQQATLNQQAAQMQQQNYWNALQTMMSALGRR